MRFGILPSKLVAIFVVAVIALAILYKLVALYTLVKPILFFGRGFVFGALGYARISG